MSERATHFRGVALLVYKDLYDMYSNLINAEQDMGYRGAAAQAERMRDDIQSYLAEHFYIFAEYLCENMKFTYAKDIPDLTEWPEDE